MKRVLKWIGIVVGAVVIVLLVAAGAMWLSTESRLTRQHTVEAEALTIPTDAASLAIGAHWAEMHCQACHGEDLGGGEFFADPALGYVDATNLTAGKGGIGATYTDADWVRAIRHGVKQDGTSVFIMPSQDFYYLNDTDLAGIIAYMKSVPPVDREIRPRNLAPLAKLLYAAGAFGNLLYAETIPHTVRPPSPPAGVTAEYGEYLVNAHGCPTCHGQQLSGQQPAEPGAPYAPNLTPGGALASWTEGDFVNTMRTGVTPYGRQMSEYMPWQGLGKMTDEELAAVWMFLQAQPALAAAAR